MPTRKKADPTPFSNIEFEVVDHAEVPPGRAGRGELGPASRALLIGQTIWMTGDNRAARFTRMAKPRGYRVRTRTGVRNGETGTYIWLEPLVHDE